MLFLSERFNSDKIKKKPNMANPNHPLSILCVASFFKGEDFMRGAKEAGCTVYLITSSQLKEANWPCESLDDIFYVNDINEIGRAHV